jgi:hypothetical protein
MDVFLFSCCVLSGRGPCERPILVHTSLSGVRLNVISKPQKLGDPVLSRAVATQETNYGKTQHVLWTRELDAWIHNRVRSDIHKLQICSTNITGFILYNFRVACKKYAFNKNFGDLWQVIVIKKGIIFQDESRTLNNTLMQLYKKSWCAVSGDVSLP